MIDFSKIKPRQNPLVSVIVPCYNVEEYIDQCLTSILNNGYDNLEIICVDDRSTDSTVEHIKKLQSKYRNIQLYHNDSDHQLYGGGCRNIGLKHATGKYVYFCDSDDYILPGLFINTIIRCEKLNADICGFQHIRIDQCGNRMPNQFNGMRYKFGVDKDVYNGYDLKNIFLFLFNAPWSKIYRFDFIKSIGARFQEIKNSDDVSFHMYTLCSAKVVTHINEPFYMYRVSTKTSVEQAKRDGVGLENIILSWEESLDIVSKFGDWYIQKFKEWMLQDLSYIHSDISYTDKFLDDVKDFIGFRFGNDSFFDVELAKFGIKKQNQSVWSRFDKIICIHYLSYKERLNKITQELTRLGIIDLPQFEWYETVDNDFYKCVLLGLKDEKFGKESNINRVNQTNINYTIDSYSLLKKLQIKGYNKVLIIEDDAIFHWDLNFIQDVISSTPEDFDIMNYDPRVLSGKFDDINENILYCKNAKITNTTCIALSKWGIDVMIENQKRQLNPFDISTWFNQDQMNVYCVKGNKHICIQDLSYENRQSVWEFSDKYPDIEISNYIQDGWEVIISLTSYPHRFMQDDFIKCLKSLVEQKTKVKYHIVLNIFKNDVPLLPSNIVKYIKDSGIEILQHETDIKQHKKYLKVMQKYKYLPVITVDDDTIYKDNLIQDMWNTHIKNPNFIICGRCDRIVYDKTGKIMPYEYWEQMIQTPNCKYSGLFGVGVGGILYPSKVCQIISDRFLQVIPYVRSDDFLMFIVSNILGFRYMTANTTNMCAKKGGSGFFGCEPLKCYNDDQAMWIMNNSTNYKNELIKYMYRFSSVNDFIDQVLNDYKNNG